MNIVEEKTDYNKEEMNKAYGKYGICDLMALKLKLEYLEGRKQKLLKKAEKMTKGKPMEQEIMRALYQC